MALERLLKEMEEHGDLMGESRLKELEAVRLEEERKASVLVEKVRQIARQVPPLPTPPEAPGSLACVDS